MQLFRTFCLLVFLFCTGSANVLFAYDLSAVELPAGSEVKWVAEDIVQNGVPMQIQQFNSGLAINQVLQFYREQWAGRANGDTPGYLENTLPGWNVISMLDNNDIVALQIRSAADGGTEGYLSTADVTSKPAEDKLTRDFPKPSGTQLISSTKSFDAGKQATTILMLNSMSPESIINFYRQAMPAKGWSMGMANETHRTAVMLFEKDAVSCELSITDGERGKVVIMANLIVNQ